MSVARTRKDAHLSDETIARIEEIAEKTGSPFSEAMRALIDDAAIKKLIELLEIETKQGVVRKQRAREGKIKQSLLNLQELYGIPDEQADVQSILKCLDD